MEHGSHQAAVETARAATLAAHAAAGCARQHRQAVRLLRAAEALCRSATALLTMSSPSPPPAAAGPGLAAPRSKRQRGRGRKKEKAFEVHAEQSSASAQLLQASVAGGTDASRTSPPQPGAVEEEPGLIGSRWLAVDAVGAAPAAALEPPAAVRTAAPVPKVPAGEEGFAEVRRLAAAAGHGPEAEVLLQQLLAHGETGKGKGKGKRKKKER